MSIEITNENNILNSCSRDFTSISNDLISAIPNMTDDWVPDNETDPGMVYIKVASALGDMLSYNRDVGVMSAFPDTTVSLNDAHNVFDALGYKMHWYQAAKVSATIAWDPTKLTDGSGIVSQSGVLPKYTTFTTKSTGITYTYIDDEINIPSLSVAGAEPNTITLYQGSPITPVLTGAYNCTTSAADKWHEVYSYNLALSDLDSDYTVTLSNINIAENTITIIDDEDYEWVETDSIAKAETGRYFEVSITSAGYPKIQFSCNPNLFGATKFKVFYIITDGRNGRIVGNTISNTPTSSAYVRSVNTLIDITDCIELSNDASKGGYNYETAEEARLNFKKVKGTVDTLITVEDFENTIKGVDGVETTKCFDSESNDFVFRFEEYISDSSGIFISVGSTSSGEPTIYIPDNCDVWIPSIRLFINDELFASCGKSVTTDAAGTKYYFYKNPDYTGASFADSGTYYNDTTHLLCFSISGMEEGDLLWVEYRCSVDFNNVLARPFIDQDYTFEDVQAEIEEVIADKKHIHLTTTIIDDTSNIVHWQPKGQINLKKQVNASEVPQIMANIKNYLELKYNGLNRAYNTFIEYTQLEDDIIAADSTVKSVRVDDVYYYILSNDGKKISHNNIQMDTVDGTVTCILTATFNYMEDQEIVLNLPNNVSVLPGTLYINLGHGIDIIRDKKVAYSRTGCSTQDPNYGYLYCDSSIIDKNNSFIYYDGYYNFNTQKQIILNVPSQTTYVGEQELIINFKFSSNNVLDFDNYEPATFYVNHKNIKEYNRGMI